MLLFRLVIVFLEEEIVFRECVYVWVLGWVGTNYWMEMGFLCDTLPEPVMD